MAPATTPAAGSGTPQATAAPWPFPRDGQPTAWTAAQIAAHAQQQREQLGEALL